MAHLEVSGSGSYACQSRAPPPRAIRHVWLTDLIPSAHQRSRGTDGERWVHAEFTLGKGLVVRSLPAQHPPPGVAGVNRLWAAPYVDGQRHAREGVCRMGLPNNGDLTSAQRGPPTPHQPYDAAVVSQRHRWQPRGTNDLEDSARDGNAAPATGRDDLLLAGDGEATERGVRRGRRRGARPRDQHGRGSARQAWTSGEIQATRLGRQNKNWYTQPQLHEEEKVMTEPAWSQGEKEFDAQVAEQQSYIAALYDVAKGSITRARDAATGVQTAASAVAVLYAGALGLVFSVTSDPLPPRGILTPIFLGLAILLANVYSAYVGKVVSVSPYPSAQLQGWLVDSENRIISFIDYSKKIAGRRSLALRASVVALAAGVFFIAAPFVNFSSPKPASTTASAMATPEALPSYPAPSPSTPSPTKLDEIRYQAQITEVAEQRKAQITADAAPAKGWTYQDRDWFIAAAIVVVVGAIVAMSVGATQD